MGRLLLGGDDSRTEAASWRQCLEDQLFSTASRAIGPRIDALNVEELLLELKQVAVIPVAIGMRRSEALSAKQAAGERFQQFTTRMRGLVIDCQNKLPCPHARPGNEVCATAGCEGVDYWTAVVKDVLLNGIADADIKREILGDATLASRTVQEVVTIVEAKEAARDTVATSHTAQTAASSTYKNTASTRRKHAASLRSTTSAKRKEMRVPERLL